MTIYQYFKIFHGYTAIIACALLLVVVVFSLYYFLTKKPISELFRKVSIFMLISLHTQLLLGLIVLFSNDGIASNFFDYKIQGKVSLMEHLPSNFAVVLLATVFYSILKRRKKVGVVALSIILVAAVLLGRTYLLLQGVINN